MWNIAEPLSPSSWLNAHEPISRFVSRTWMRHRERLRCRAPASEEALDLVGAHRAVLVARQPRDLGVRVPAHGSRAGCRGDVAPEHDERALDAAPETSADGAIRAGARYTIARMRRWSEVAERVAATTRTSEKTALLADYLALARRRRAADRGRVPHRPAVPRGRPAHDRHRLGDDRGRRRGRSRAPTATRSAAAYDRFSDISAAVGDVLPRPATRRTRPAQPSLAEVAATFEAIEAGVRPGREGRRCSRPCSPGPTRGRRAAIVKVLSGELRIGLREGLRRGGAREGVRPPARRREAGGDAHRRHRPHRDARPRRTGSAARELALFHPLKFMLASPAEDAAEILAAARARPSGSRTSTTASAPSCTGAATRSASTRATCTTSAASSRRSSRRARDLPWAGILDGELLAWSDGVVLPFLQLQARLGRKDPSAKILDEVPVIYVALDVLGMDRDADDRRSTPLLDGPLTERAAPARDARACRSPTEGGRFALAPRVGRLDRRRSRRRSPRPGRGATRA